MTGIDYFPPGGGTQGPAGPPGPQGPPGAVGYTLHSGMVTLDGIAIRLPPGWSVSKPNVGYYKITKPYDAADRTNDYNCAVSPSGNWIGYCGMYGTDGVDFYVNTYAPDGSKMDMSFSFIVTRVTP